ncbi:claudin-10-like [Neoarius graeffei]|uniref:claudin-10-like n=1 Tax=Neoarius graeffei TaxID=443677 RepID=UPI00298BE6D6|nr:claudin-10-like [Neoarius graeffei]
MGTMVTEIVAFVISLAGWVLVTSTIPTDYWKVSTNDGTVITTATYWCNLWRICVTDSAGVSDCKDYPSLLALDGHLHACRGLMIAAVCLGFFATACALVGMKCTTIGGSDELKERITCASGLQYFISGICSLTAFSMYANRTLNEFFDPRFLDQKYELGAALFIGWVGSIMCILGGIAFSLLLFDDFRKRGKLGTCTRKSNEIKALLIENGDVEKVELLMKDFVAYLNDFKDVHGKVQDLLGEDERETDYVEWYEP